MAKKKLKVLKAIELPHRMPGEISTETPAVEPLLADAMSLMRHGETAKAAAAAVKLDEKIVREAWAKENDRG